MSRIVLVNTPELLCPDTHYLHVKKFLQGFVQSGYPLLEINDEKEIDNLHENDIIYISNHGINHTILSVDAALRQLTLLEEKSQYAILWHFHDVLFKHAYKPRFKKVVLTGHWTNGPIGHPTFDVYRKEEDFVPMRFLTSLHPSDIEDPLEKAYDACFIGTPYKIPWIQAIAHRHNVFAHFGKPWLPEDDRLRVLKTSTIGLGFGADQNVKEGVMTERVVESMAYGCVVISDCPTAPERTANAAIYVASEQHTLATVQKILDDPAFAKEKMDRGIEFVRSEGTYFHLAQDMLRHLELI